MPQQAQKIEKISVVIAARNEELQLQMNLEYVLSQNYPDFEVIVVNHNSTDRTKEVLNELMKKYAHLFVYDCLEGKGKKFPLSIGITKASGNIIVSTDADCRPSSNNWLKMMVGSLRGEKEIVLGYSPYDKKEGWLNALIRYDSFMVALQYLSFANINHPYMGVGRNLLYRKELFEKANGFEKHLTILSGDDDLFISEVASAKNTTFCIHPNSCTISSPKTSFGAFFKQKRRHLTTAPEYKMKTKILLLCLNISQLLFTLSAILLLILGKNLSVVIGLVIFRIIVQWSLYRRLMPLLGVKDLLKLFPFYELTFTLFYPIVALSNFVFKPTEWTT